MVSLAHPRVSSTTTLALVVAELVWPVAKQAASLRVDRDVLAWFRAQGSRYQSRMNAVLRTYRTHVRRRPRRRRLTGAA